MARGTYICRTPGVKSWRGTRRREHLWQFLLIFHFWSTILSDCPHVVLTARTLLRVIRYFDQHTEHPFSTEVWSLETCSSRKFRRSCTSARPSHYYHELSPGSAAGFGDESFPERSTCSYLRKHRPNTWYFHLSIMFTKVRIILRVDDVHRHRVIYGMIPQSLLRGFNLCFWLLKWQENQHIGLWFMWN